MEIKRSEVLREISGGDRKLERIYILVIRSMFSRLRVLFWESSRVKIVIGGFCRFSSDWNRALKYGLLMYNGNCKVDYGNYFRDSVDRVLRGDLVKCRFLYEKWGGDIAGNKYRFLGRYFSEVELEDIDVEGYGIIDGVKIVKDI